MSERITLSKFNKLPLEERAQIAIKNIFYEEAKIENDEISLLHFGPFIESLAYLEKNGYVALVGGTPKSRVSYRITKKGVEFMDKED
jgi:hypothetical protein